MLGRHGITPSMSRRGNCYDNAVMESFFSALRREWTYHQRYATREAARQSLFEYIEVFYNRRRLHSTLGYVSPAEYEANQRRTKRARNQKLNREGNRTGLSSLAGPKGVSRGASNDLQPGNCLQPQT